MSIRFSDVKPEPCLLIFPMVSTKYMLPLVFQRFVLQLISHEQRNTMSSDSSQKIILLDLASNDGKGTWSLNPWKTRFVLNFKGLDYETEFLEYPQLKTRIEPHVPDAPAYTSPTIRYTDGTYIIDSKAIAQAIEERHPEPSLDLDSPVLPKVEELLDQAGPALRPEYIPAIPKRLLNQASVPYWYETREAAFGLPLDELAKTKGGARAWSEAEPYLRQVTELLRASPEGPYFAGKTVTYTDFVWAGFLIFWRRIGDDKFDELLRRTGDGKVHEDLLKALEPWSERATY